MATGLALFLSTSSAQAGSATWDLNPGSAEWNTAGNWTPATIPNGPADTAIFSTSNVTNITVSAHIALAGIVFDNTADAFTLTPSSSFGWAISGVGIENNSAVVQNFVLRGDGAGGAGELGFYNNATAGSATLFTNSNGGEISFLNRASAGSATIVNEGATNAQESEGVTSFHNASSAANATIINHGAVDGGLASGYTEFSDASSGGSATLIANGGGVRFFDNSNGDSARVQVLGGGELNLIDHSRGTVTIGSLEGDGLVYLGRHTLMIGSNSLNTTFSGPIQEGIAGGVERWRKSGPPLSPSLERAFTPAERASVGEHWS